MKIMQNLLKAISLSITITLGLCFFETVKIISIIYNTPDNIEFNSNLDVPAFSLKDNEDMSFNLNIDNLKSDPIVRIYKGNDFICTGTIISSKYILTAAHCLKTSSNKIDKDTTYDIMVYAYNNSIPKLFRKANALVLNNQTDYALMLGDFSGLNTFKVALSTNSAMAYLDASTPKNVCGYPYGQPLLACFSIKDSENKYFQMQSIGVLYPGMSGGPVLDRNTTTVIGVNSSVGNGVIITSTLVGLFESLGVPVEKE